MTIRSADTLTITIQGKQFSTSIRFREGHVCTLAEAKALNMLFAENLRNNFSKQMKPLDAAGVPEEVILAKWENYARNYQFTTLGSTHRDPTEREAFKIATTLVREAFAKRGVKVDDLAEGVFDANVAKVALRSDVLAEAARRIEAAKGVALAALDLDTDSHAEGDE